MGLGKDPVHSTSSREDAKDRPMELQNQFGVFPKIALAILGCFLAGWVVFIILHSQTPYLPQPGGVIDLRGKRIALLRLPTIPVQELGVDEDGRAVLLAYPMYSSSISRINLTAGEQRELAVLLADWCQQLPTFRSLRPDESFYDLGIRCGSWPSTKVKQTRVPIEALPLIFAQLLKRLPPLVPSIP